MFEMSEELSKGLEDLFRGLIAIGYSEPDAIKRISSVCKMFGEEIINGSFKELTK